MTNFFGIGIVFGKMSAGFECEAYLFQTSPIDHCQLKQWLRLSPKNIRYKIKTEVTNYLHVAGMLVILYFYIKKVS